MAAIALAETLQRPDGKYHYVCVNVVLQEGEAHKIHLLNVEEQKIKVFTNEQAAQLILKRELIDWKPNFWM